MQGLLIASLVRELRFYMPCSIFPPLHKKKKKKKIKKKKQKPTSYWAEAECLGSLGSFAVVPIQAVGGCGSEQRKKHSNVFSVILERELTLRGFHHQFD